MRTLQELLEDFYNNKLEADIYTSTNEHNDNVMIEAKQDVLIITTFQSNGWARINEYYKDGTTTESYSK